MGKPPNFSKDVITNRNDLEKSSTIMLNELCSPAIINGLSIKMGDLDQLTLRCEFGNSTSINALADSGASINFIPYSFYKNLGLTRFQETKMTLRMLDHSIINPYGIIEDFLLQVGKFVFPIEFMVLDMKEDEELHIIFGWPFFSTERALVYIHNSKRTLCLEDEAITFEMSPKVSHEKPKYEMSKMHVVEEDINELEEIEKMMEEELKV
ncbi:uncharacterized protein LOC111914765 [Lactuca sativa]|uniref:uncharacterized protein LOC111914765 n=1 Tax=Lactuca sativa TaxID=4236 RepID=UPI000CD95D8F|nr:uncharacterized protein LOC111914765 [Lactuca sativa]